MSKKTLIRILITIVIIGSLFSLIVFIILISKSLSRQNNNLDTYEYQIEQKLKENEKLVDNWVTDQRKERAQIKAEIDKLEQAINDAGKEQ